MNYRLKKGQENFTPMSGGFEGKKFLRGVEYSAIPPEEKGRFEKVPEPKQKPKESATKQSAGGGEK